MTSSEHSLLETLRMRRDSMKRKVKQLVQKKNDRADETTSHLEDDSSIVGHEYILSPLPDVLTSFVHCIWSGSQQLADYLTSSSELVDGNCTVSEIDAEMGIPSLIALTGNSSLSYKVDLSDGEEVSRDTEDHNWETTGCPNGRVAVVGRDRGSSIDNIRHVIAQTIKPQVVSAAENDELTKALQDEQCFCLDLDIFSECLWMDNTLDYDLAKSLKNRIQHRSSSTSASSSKDDAEGHFEGEPGTMIIDRYRVTGDVGMGTFGRVVEGLDLEKVEKSHILGGRTSRQKDQHWDAKVAIKIVRNVKNYYDSALIEADIIKDVNRRGGRGTTHCVVMHNAFTFCGHFCLVFECLGPSLYDFLKRHDYQPFPMVCVRHFCRQLLEALEFLHSFNLIHTDLKPENILLTNCCEEPYEWQGRTYQIPESTQIKLIDFGGATYDDEKKSSVVNTRQYRAPEVILGLGWSTQIDLWSAGCIIAELYMGELLFATRDNIEHLALMERIVGGFSGCLLERSKNSPIAQEAFDSSGRHLLGAVLGKESTAYVQGRPRLEQLVDQRDSGFLVLLRRLLVIDPDERAPASELVQCIVQNDK